MYTIWKYALIPGNNRFMIPKKAVFLDIQVQDGVPCMWAFVDPNVEKETCVIRIYGTGHQIPVEKEKLAYMGTFQIERLVFHAFYDLGESGTKESQSTLEKFSSEGPL